MSFNWLWISTLLVINNRCCSLAAVWCSANKPNLWASPLGHPPRRNWLHRGRNVDLRCTAGTYLVQVAKPVSSRGRHKLRQEQARGQASSSLWIGVYSLRNNTEHPSTRPTTFSSSTHHYSNWHSYEIIYLSKANCTQDVTDTSLIWRGLLSGVASHTNYHPFTYLSWAFLSYINIYAHQNKL